MASSKVGEKGQATTPKKTASPKTSTPRKGRAPKAFKAREVPGRPGKWPTFNMGVPTDASLGAYLAYQNTADLRKLLWSWPVMLAFTSIKADPSLFNVKKTNWRAIFQCLRQETASLVTGIHQIDARYPWNDDLSKDDANLRRNTRYACWINSLRVWLEQMRTNSPAANVTAHKNCSVTWITQLKNSDPASDVLPKYDLPLIDYSSLRFPELGPLTEKGETIMETWNRLIQLLRYAALATTDTRLGYSCKMPPASVVIDKLYIPNWMRPDEAGEGRDITPEEEVPQLHEKDIHIIWKTGNNDMWAKEVFEEYLLLDNMEFEVDQIAQFEPRVMELPTLRDAIKSQFNLLTLVENEKFQISKVYISWEGLGGEGQMTRKKLDTVKVPDEDWQAVLNDHDGACIDFSCRMLGVDEEEWDAHRG